MSLKKIKEHYWACNDCMTEAGGKFPEGHICTMIKSNCELCGAKDQLMAPWVDCNWPNKEDDLIAKANRD